jgi:hypothetical protein
METIHQTHTTYSDSDDENDGMARQTEMNQSQQNS